MNDAPPFFLPYGQQQIDDDDIAAVVEVLRGDRLTSGPKTFAFDEALAKKVGARFAVSCSSGTAALHLAALACELGPRDTVLVPSLTFVATANAARYVGAEVFFVDVDPETGLITQKTLEEALARTPNARAVFPVHLNGQCVDMKAIGVMARERGLRIVEDGCHALGASHPTQGREQEKVGACAHSDLCTFSFHPVKTIAMGEGGAITTNNEALYARALRLRNHGIVYAPKAPKNKKLARASTGEINPWYYEMSEIGLNYRPSEIHCALGLSQLTKLDHFVARRRELAGIYDRLLAPLAPSVRPIKKVPGMPAWHLYVVHIDFAALDVSRADLINRLRNYGIGTQVHYSPVHLQPYYRERYGDFSLPGTESYSAKCLSLPLFPGMANDDAERVVDAICKILNI